MGSGVDAEGRAVVGCGEGSADGLKEGRADTDGATVGANVVVGADDGLVVVGAEDGFDVVGTMDTTAVDTAGRGADDWIPLLSSGRLGDSSLSAYGGGGSSTFRSTNVLRLLPPQGTAGTMFCGARWRPHRDQRRTPSEHSGDNSTDRRVRL